MQVRGSWLPLGFLSVRRAHHERKTCAQWPFSGSCQDRVSIDFSFYMILERASHLEYGYQFKVKRTVEAILQLRLVLHMVLYSFFVRFSFWKVFFSCTVFNSFRWRPKTKSCGYKSNRRRKSERAIIFGLLL